MDFSGITKNLLQNNLTNIKANIIIDKINIQMTHKLYLLVNL